jgi:hypothetical protein
MLKIGKGYKKIMVDSSIKLVEPIKREPTPDDTPFYRLNNVCRRNLNFNFDISSYKETKYQTPFSWITTLDRMGWKLPSLEEYHAVFSYLYDKRDNPNFKDQVNKLKNIFANSEFSDGTKTCTSTFIEYCGCGEANIFQNYNQSNNLKDRFNEFTPGKIGSNSDHEKALTSLVGIGDVDRVAAVWGWISGKKISLDFEAMRNPNRLYTVTIGRTNDLDIGILVGDYSNVTLEARAFRRI